MTDAIEGGNLEEILATLKLVEQRQRERKIDYFEPYPKQQQFFDMGAWLRERLFLAGNQLGKSYTGAAETAYHLTGEYPSWWLGRRFNKPVTGWAAGEGATIVRDGPQKLLCGPPGIEAELGTGMIPKECFVDTPSKARGVTDAYDTIQVRHKTDGREDGVSTLGFKSYEQGRPKFQAATLDFGWCDEEPPYDIYSEMLTRTNATGGMLFSTFTPLKGMSDVVIRFLQEKSEDRDVVTMTIDEAPHISPEERKKIIAGYKPYERDARTKGIPMLGSGRIFTSSEAMISEPMIEHLPPPWTKLWGIDFGIGHPFAAVLIAWDRDNDVIHVLHTIRMSDALPISHAQAMKIVGRNVPVAWPRDGTNRDAGSGKPLASQYKELGLAMLPDHATFPDGSLSTEAGIAEMDSRFTSARLRVAGHLADFFEEYRLYHRKDGLIVKLRDDILSALRIAIMAKRFSRAVPLGSEKRRREQGQIADGVDFDMF